MKRFTHSLCLSLLTSLAVFGQGNEFIFSWNVAIPGEGLNDIIAKTSFQGWVFEYRYALSDQFTVGGSVGLNVFSEEHDLATWQVDNVTISAKDWRYAHMVPILVNAHFNPMRNQGAPLQVFLGGGFGTSYVNQEVWPGMYTIRKEDWAFAMYPEIGLRYVMSDQTAIFFSTQYMFMPDANFNNNNLAYWNLRLGFSFGTHRW